MLNNNFVNLLNNPTKKNKLINDDIVFSHNDNRTIIVFNPEQIKSVDNRGTFSKDNPDIFYQSGVVDMVKNLFKPKDKDKRTYISDLRAVERGDETRIRVGELPQVYKELGLSAGMVRTNKDVILKDSIEKHYVPLNVVEDLPELFADPIMVMDSRSVDGRLVAVLDAVDKKGQQVIVAISPNKKQEGGYHFIPSFYGKTKISNFIETNINEGNLKYIKSQQALDTLQLRTQVKTLLGSLNNNILQKSDVVKKKPKMVYQGEGKKGKRKAKAMYIPAQRAIYLFKNAG